LARYLFLSDEWMAEVKKIHDRHRERIGTVSTKVRVNQVVTDAPFGDGTVRAHIDSSSGDVEVGLGHVDDADISLTLDYETAKSLFLGGDPQAAIQAFMAGKIKFEGDLSKLMIAQGATPDATASELLADIKEVTAE
jgi:putative sterol carrier protein